MKIQGEDGVVHYAFARRVADNTNVVAVVWAETLCQRGPYAPKHYKGKADTVPVTCLTCLAEGPS